MNTALLVSCTLLIIVIGIGGVDLHRFSRPRIGLRRWGRKPVCPRHYCKNGGVCRRRGRSYYCRCPRGFTGRRCGCEIDECATKANNCKGNSQCVNIIGGPGVTCQCLPGFTDPGCKCEIDECATANTREGNSQCTNIIGGPGVTCQCPTGFTGQNCETNIDDCQAETCKNNGTCVDGIDSSMCQCPDGFKGRFCELECKLTYQTFEESILQFGCIKAVPNGTDCSVACQEYNCTASLLASDPPPNCFLYIDPIIAAFESSIFVNDTDACENKCRDEPLCEAAVNWNNQCFLFNSGYVDLRRRTFQTAFIVEKVVKCKETM